MKKKATKRIYIDYYYHIKEIKIGCNVIKLMNKYVNKLLPNNTKIKAALKSNKLTSCFNIKDKLDFEHNHDLNSKCTEPTYIGDNVGESARRITETIKYHNGRDIASVDHSIEKSHKNVNTTDLKIIDKNIVIRNGKIVWKVDWIQHYLRLILNSRRY